MCPKLKLTTKDKSGTDFPYRACIGVPCTYYKHSPDLVKSVCYLACFVENPGISHKTALERVLRYLSSSTDKGIKYQSPTNGGGGTRTTALLLQTLTSVAIQPRTRAHLDTFAFWNANMRTMSSTGFRANKQPFLVQPQKRNFALLDMALQKASGKDCC